MYYKNGFFLEPQENSVELTDKQYEALIIGQSQGKQIMTGNDGFPILVEPQPSPWHNWENGEWVINPEKQAALKAQQQEQVRQAINTKRDQTDAGGVFVEALGKWVDSDEKAYQNILGVKASLDLLGDMDIPWTWADNSSSIINRTMLAAIVGSLLQTKQQNHANALKHKEAMMAVDNPLDYDYSQGWSKTYADYLAEVGNE
ncbi:DUF4376 domain-containing protein [Actinobacillus porcinus]|uniref:DUF4376 domain-containing protein n=1 Tax=Actinobacillus porcinus TaxID=51048 RepID=UPI002353D378|nr:DUF4376 domain-containing protein [Actinobacillus porcinus]